VGPVGNAAVVKLAVNALFAAQMAAFAEVAAAIERSSIDTDTALSFISSLPVTSPAMQRALTVFQSGTFAPNFPVELVAKDLRYAQEAFGKPDRAGGSVLATTTEAFEAAITNGYGNDDISGVIQSYR
jgi:3-hydroxyisobutyrate dehydrogenase